MREQARTTVQEIPDSKLLLVARRWTKRGKNTDFEHFFDFFPNAIRVTTGDELQSPYRVLKAISKQARQDGYTSYSVGMEAAAMGRMLRHRPRLVHFWYADHEYHYAWMAARAVGAKIVGTFFFSVEEFEDRMPHKRHLKHLDLVIASGRFQMEYLKQYVDERRLVYLPLGVDCSFFKPPGDPSLRWENGPRLLQVGVNRRDFDTLHKVIGQLHVHYPNLRLEMVGCRDVQDQFEGDSFVVFHPFLSDEELLQVYQRATVMLLPLLEGGSSNALNEAMAAGLPVVATRMPNLEDYVSKEGVRLCPPGDARAMAQACRELIDNRAAWEKASAAAVQHVSQYDWPNIKQQLLKYYEERLGLRVVNS
ncbi:MAG: glycosyltransferase [Anaerolineae bacterium]|nr:glycosyltransferase [Anaerolineae bacterium]